MGGVCWLVGGPNCRLPTCPQTRPKGGTDRNRASSQHDQGPSFGGSRSKAERREGDQPKPTLPFPYRFTPHNRLIRQTLDGGAHSDVSPAFAQRIAGTNGHPTPASAKAKTHGRYHLIRTTISPDALIGPWRSAPFVHPCRPGAPIHPFRLHSTEDPYPQCLLPSSSSFSTFDPVSRSHQASIDNSTSLTDLSNIHLHFLPYQSHLSFSSLLAPFALIISHFATHQFDHPLTTNQPTIQETHISCQLQSFWCLGPSVLQPISAYHLQEFQSAIATCPLAFQSPASSHWTLNCASSCIAGKISTGSHHKSERPTGIHLSFPTISAPNLRGDLADRSSSRHLSTSLQPTAHGSTLFLRCLDSCLDSLPILASAG